MSRPRARSESAGAPSAWRRPLARDAAPAGLDVVRFEVESRGDWVPGRLLLPDDSGRRVPLILLQHDLGGARDDATIEAAALAWARAGAAVASVDWPLHGARRSLKLTHFFCEDVRRALRGEEVREPALWLEVARQGATDLARALDLLEREPGVDAERIGYAGVGLGALLGASFCANDARLRAVALALGGAAGPAEADPARHIARIAPRQLLLVSAEPDARIARACAERLHAAAGAPSQVLLVEGDTETAIARAALEEAGTFLRGQL